MIKKNIDNWVINPKLDCLLFFAYLVDEMSFNYTIDSFKAPALNTHSLCVECLNTIVDIESLTISKGALSSIIEELKWSIENDLVIHKIINSKRLKQYCDRLKNERDIRFLKSLVEIIYQSIRKDYFNNIKQALSELIIENREKAKIEQLTRTFLTELLNMGYSNEYIYFTSRDFFFADKKIENINALNEYFNQFSNELVKYKVLYLGSPLFKTLKAPSEALGFKVNKTFTEYPNLPNISSYISRHKNNKVFLFFEEIEANDPYSARKEALNTIEKASSLFAFFHHKTELTWRMESIVWNENYCNLISKPINQILNCKDLRPAKASKELNDTINVFGLHHDSFRRVDKSIDFHETAITSQSIENQFVNLFTAFEILIPKEKESHKDRICQIADSLIPFLFLDYNSKLIKHLVKCISDWNYNYFRKLLRDISDGTNHFEKVCALISLTKYDALRSELLSKLHEENYVLLKNRVFKLNKIFSTTKELKNHIETHEIRVRWHIDRIYRTRNLIVHSGEIPSYTETLIENLHSYYDILIRDIFRMVINGREINTLEQAYIEKQISYLGYKELLEQNVKNEMQESNFKELIIPE